MVLNLYHKSEGELESTKESLIEIKNLKKELKNYTTKNEREAWNNKARTLYGQGKYDEAIQAYDKAIEI